MKSVTAAKQALFVEQNIWIHLAFFIWLQYSVALDQTKFLDMVLPSGKNSYTHAMSPKHATYFFTKHCNRGTHAVVSSLLLCCLGAFDPLNSFDA